MASNNDNNNNNNAVDIPALKKKVADRRAAVIDGVSKVAPEWRDEEYQLKKSPSSNALHAITCGGQAGTRRMPAHPPIDLIGSLTKFCGTVMFPAEKSSPSIISYPRRIRGNPEAKSTMHIVKSAVKSLLPLPTPPEPLIRMSTSSLLLPIRLRPLHPPILPLWLLPLLLLLLPPLPPTPILWHSSPFRRPRRTSW